MLYDRSEVDMQIEEIASDICKACKTRRNCDNYLCSMSVIVASELVKKYQPKSFFTVDDLRRIYSEANDSLLEKE